MIAVPLTIIQERISIVAGTPVTIQCDIPASSPDNGETAFVDGIPTGVIRFAPGVCALLQHPDSIGADPVTAEAFLDATHEAMHVRNADLDETHTECQAVLNRWQFVRLFRLPSWMARAIMAGEVAVDRALPADPYHNPQEPCT